MLTLTTAVQILAGLLIPLGAAFVLHRRAGRAAALANGETHPAPLGFFLPGVIAALALLVFTPLLERGAALAVVLLLPGGGDAGTANAVAANALPIFAGIVGIASGFLATGALVIVLVWLARTARTFPRLLLIGFGFGGTEVILRAVIAALILVANLRLAETPPENWGLPPEELAAREADLDAYFARSPLEPLLDLTAAAGKVALGAALAVMVGVVFLTGAVGWYFGAALWGGIATAGGLIFSNAGPLPVAVWWLVVLAVSVALLWWVGSGERQESGG